MVEFRRLRGETSRTATITEETAQAVLDAKGTMTNKACAEKFADAGVTLNIVGSIWNKRRWKHLKRTTWGD